MTNFQQTTLWLGAFRYYCGRMTYAVGDFCDLLIAEWPSLPDTTRNLIKKELEEAFKHDIANRSFNEDNHSASYLQTLGNDCDRAEWEKVRALWK